MRPREVCVDLATPLIVGKIVVTFSNSLGFLRSLEVKGPRSPRRPQGRQS
jgi:hypothetical protein